MIHSPFLPSFRCNSVTRKFFGPRPVAGPVLRVIIFDLIIPHHDSISLSHRCPFVGPTAPSHGVPNTGDHPILS